VRKCLIVFVWRLTIEPFVLADLKGLHHDLQQSVARFAIPNTLVQLSTIRQTHFPKLQPHRQQKQ
jgi:hypothetical protein